MNKNIDNTSVCVRCGKQRIIVSIKEEKIGNSVVTYKETSCPDPLCQEKVVVTLAQEQEKRHQSFVERQNRMNSKKRA